MQIWSNCLQMIFFKGSHCFLLQASYLHNEMLEIHHNDLCECVSIIVNMKKEGLWAWFTLSCHSYAQYSRSLLDACCTLTIISDCAITFVFAVQELINNWVKIQLLYSLKLKRKVAKINSSFLKIETNFEVLQWTKIILITIKKRAFHKLSLIINMLLCAITQKKLESHFDEIVLVSV